MCQRTFFTEFIPIFALGYLVYKCLNINTMKKLWQIALEEFVDKIHFENKPLYNDGISIPMMIGIYYNVGVLSQDDLNSYKCIQYVLADILETTVFVKITKCNNCLYNYIISVKNVADLIDVNPHINNKIYLQLQFDGNKQSFTIQEVSEKLYEKYHTAITNMTFSYNNGTWTDFNDKEKYIIKIVLQNFIESR